MSTSWGIAEWYGHDIRTMSGAERSAAARAALEAHEEGLHDAPQPVCPFLSSVWPDSVCNKIGGVCSIRKYTNDPAVAMADDQPAAVCPNRFLETSDQGTIFALIAQELFAVEAGAKVVKEIPFLEKVSAAGKSRGAMAGRIDWIVVPEPPTSATAELKWVAVETQAVYFSGGAIWGDIEAYAQQPDELHYPTQQRRPDYRSSGAKRLAPQLDAKSPVMRRWGRKVVVVIDRGFADEMGTVGVVSQDFDNCEVALFIVRFEDDMRLVLDEIILTELTSAIGALQATAPIHKATFEADLRAMLSQPSHPKVHNA